MKNNLLFDFSVNKENKTIHVTREFAGNLDLVWKAWTTAELLDQWWAPKPYRNQTKSLDFREGGQWIYKMISPENEEHWCKLDYKNIEHFKSYSGLDAFCDEQGNINMDFPRSLWKNNFKEAGEKTTVAITIAYDKPEDLEKIIEMGFKEGFTMCMQNLDELLETWTKKITH